MKAGARLRGDGGGRHSVHPDSFASPLARARVSLLYIQSHGLLVRLRRPPTSTLTTSALESGARSRSPAEPHLVNKPESAKAWSFQVQSSQRCQSSQDMGDGSAIEASRIPGRKDRECACCTSSAEAGPASGSKAPHTRYTAQSVGWRSEGARCCSLGGRTRTSVQQSRHCGVFRCAAIRGHAMTDSILIPSRAS